MIPHPRIFAILLIAIVICSSYASSSPLVDTERDGIDDEGARRHLSENENSAHNNERELRRRKKYHRKRQNNTDFIVKFKDNEMHQSFCNEQDSQDKNDITSMNVMQSLPSLGAEVIKFESEIEAMAWSKSRTDVAYIE